MYNNWKKILKFINKAGLFTCCGYQKSIREQTREMKIYNLFNEPMNDTDFKEFCENIGKGLPQNYLDFFSFMNGCRLFCRKVNNRYIGGLTFYEADDFQEINATLTNRLKSLLSEGLSLSHNTLMLDEQEITDWIEGLIFIGTAENTSLFFAVDSSRLEKKDHPIVLVDMEKPFAHVSELDNSAILERNTQRLLLKIIKAPVSFLTQDLRSSILFKDPDSTDVWYPQKYKIVKQQPATDSQ